MDIVLSIQAPHFSILQIVLFDQGIFHQHKQYEEVAHYVALTDLVVTQEI